MLRSARGWVFLLLCFLGLAGVNVYFWWQSAVVAKVPKNLRPKHGYQQSALEPTIAPRDLKFENEAIRDKFLKADSAARHMTGLGWTTRAEELYRPERGDRGRIQGYWESPTQVVEITTRSDRQNAGGFELSAQNIPLEGWGASLRYSVSINAKHHHEHFGLWFWSPEIISRSWGRALRSDDCLPLSPGNVAYKSSLNDDKFTYTVSVNSRNISQGEFHRGFRPSAVEFKAYWESAESFRQASLGELSRLEVRGREQIASGEAIETVEYGPYHGDGLPPESRSRPEHPIPDSIKKLLLDTFEIELAKRKQLVEQNYTEMHRVALETFPALREIVVGIDPSSDSDPR